MGGRSNHSFNKRQKERQRKEKAQKKIERRQARKLEPATDATATLDDVAGEPLDDADEQVSGATATREG